MFASVVVYIIGIQTIGRYKWMCVMGMERDVSWYAKNRTKSVP